ncbi:MAG TPA: SpoVG family protein [Planctomycetaceae bacterium]|nr:SpoVG family protein [Planctomycetaceae bacterium]
MEITEVRIKLMDDSQERLQAFCSITFDHCFVIRDLKIIEGAKGSFVAMPSRKLTDRCPRCNTKNHLRALFCNQCGAGLIEERAGKDADGRAKLYADIAHPINSRCRELIQSRVMDAFREEQVRARQPGYVCTYDDYGEDAYADLSELEPVERRCLSSAGSVHRIEAANGAIGAPHLNASSRTSEPEHVVAGRPLGLDRDEGFGAGIV